MASWPLLRSFWALLTPDQSRNDSWHSSYGPQCRVANSLLSDVGTSVNGSKSSQLRACAPCAPLQHRRKARDCGWAPFLPCLRELRADASRPNQDAPVAEPHDVSRPEISIKVGPIFSARSLSRSRISFSSALVVRWNAPWSSSALSADG